MDEPTRNKLLNIAPVPFILVNKIQNKKQQLLIFHSQKQKKKEEVDFE